MLQEVLKHPLHLHLLKSPPGSGKTHSMVVALAEHFNRKKLTRVLWAVPSTLEHAHATHTPLAREAQDLFKEHTIQSQILYGKDTFEAQQRKLGITDPKTIETLYQQQFEWDEDTPIKIISHAHLPWLVGKLRLTGRTSGFSKVLRGVDLLVVDENPTSAFLSVHTSHSPIDLVSLKGLTSSSLLSNSLAKLLEAAPGLTSGMHRWEHMGTATHFLQGKPFWDLWQKHQDFTVLTKKDFQAFQKELQDSTGQRHPGVAFAQTVRHMMAHPARPVPMNFGVTWQTRGPGKAIHQVPRFCYSINLARPPRSPTLVLDAYGDKVHYELLFQATVQMHQPIEENAVLKVKNFPTLQLNAGLLEQSKSMGQLKVALMEAFMVLHTHVETKKRAQPRALLLIDQKAKTTLEEVMDTVPEVQAFKNLTCTSSSGTPEPAQVEIHHWHAGRGKNDWEGFHVVALTVPHYPRIYKQHNLTALLPEDSVASEGMREQLATQHEADELLQMLHRSRQLHHPEALLLTFHLPADLQKDPRLDVEDIEHQFFIKKYDQKPYEKARLLLAAKELYKLFKGAIPEAALMALKLLRVRPGHEDVVRQAEARLLELLDNNRKQSRPLKLPELERWLSTGQLMDDPPIDEDSKLVLEVLKHWMPDLTTFDHNLHRKTTGKGIQMRFYSDSESKFKKALAQLRLK